MAIFSHPTNDRTLTNVFPGIDVTHLVELGRFVLLDEVPGNGETWFLARCFEELRRRGLRGLVSFSDPVPRTSRDGRTVFPGHLGTIYQASNAHYLGRGTARTLKLDPNGCVVSERGLQKVRAGERGWLAVPHELAAFRAPVPAADPGPTSAVTGKPIRESRDIPGEHEESIPLMMLFDVTGSMGRIPQMLQKKLASLMDVVQGKTGLKDLQVLVGAIGDATCDRYPLQVGQFESDNRFDDQLRNIILEGNGGGQHYESYGLAYRFAAHHTVTDAFEKRGKRGYLFTMGDEAPWPTVPAHTVQTLFKVGAESDESVADLLAKVQERWEVFHLHAQDGNSASRGDPPRGTQRFSYAARSSADTNAIAPTTTATATIARRTCGLVRFPDSTYETRCSQLFRAM